MPLWLLLSDVDKQSRFWPLCVLRMLPEYLTFQQTYFPMTYCNFDQRLHLPLMLPSSTFSQILFSPRIFAKICWDWTSTSSPAYGYGTSRIPTDSMLEYLTVRDAVAPSCHACSTNSTLLSWCIHGNHQTFRYSILIRKSVSKFPFCTEAVPF